MKRKKNIVFVSISSDMYGSSKVLLFLVRRLKEESSAYNPIVCMPYEEGPLKEILRAEGIDMIEMPVVKLTRSMLKSFGVFTLAKEYFKAKKTFKKATKNLDIACIQSNTLATMFGGIYCFFRKKKHIVHVHEIMDRPKAAQFFFKNYLRFFANHIVYNSVATQEFYNGICPSLQKKSVTIVNGVDNTTPPLSKDDRINKRKELFNASEDDLLIGLVGRINRLKGHTLLLNSFKKLSSSYPKAKLCFIGSPPPNQEFFLSNLKETISDLDLTDKVAFLDFQETIFPVLESLDIVTVPSTEPESFGLIVVEAMLAKKLVVASKIGGISTILEDEKTGLFFEPNNEEDFTKALIKAMENPILKQKIENNAYTAAVDQFSITTMYTKFKKFYSQIL
ncbi:glycosyltransferase family 4 protein [Marixanthomonas sp. SCSIO 43207]|uniref:glycosyltransferase family 4 protein n=1 Tax=Marixanthomonas sp. SCSIO 43207 TaxID=2779360 RepID=UPI001CA7E9D2|nr:glycosyltransferase family 4 protein [Marixanthomonas sp. SCSIO 43207]UAB81921.1 glycosyltransferase family 4 protein [Marixanthomonas sp. SCSIO 43207]